MGVLYVFVEGTDDEIFIRNAFWQFEEKYRRVRYIRYAQKRDDQVKNIISACDKRSDWDYVMFTDFDSMNENGAKCVSVRKKRLQKRYDNILDNDKIYIVKEEIESWFAACIDYSRFQLKGLSKIKDTEIISKELFEENVKKKFRHVTDFMIESMKSFNLQQGIERNQSLNYTYNKLFNGEKL